MTHINEGDYARIAGTQTLVGTFEQNEDGTWDTKIVRQDAAHPGIDTSAVAETDLTPLAHQAGFSGVPGNAFPELVTFNYHVWPLPSYTFSVTSDPAADTATLEISSMTTDFPSGNANTTLPKSAFGDLFNLVSSVAWKDNYSELMMDGYSWSMNVVIGDTVYSTSGSNSMPDELKGMSALLNAIIDGALAASDAQAVHCPAIEDCA